MSDLNGEALLKRDIMDACAKGEVVGHFLLVLIKDSDSRTYSHGASKWELWGSVVHGLVRTVVKEDIQEFKELTR